MRDDLPLIIFIVPDQYQLVRVDWLSKHGHLDIRLKGFLNRNYPTQ